MLYCTEKDSTGFYLIKGATEGERTGFKLSRYILKFISETERTITPTIGDVKGSSRGYSCRRPKHHRPLAPFAGVRAINAPNRRREAT